MADDAPLTTPETTTAPPVAQITAVPNGPLVVDGGIDLVRRRAVHSEHGEPLTWETTDTLDTRQRYLLCRCGASANKPFCDQSHRASGFTSDDHDGGAYPDRANELGGTGLTVRDDRSICVHAGFCGNRVSNIWKQVGETAESTVRLQVINEVEKCPSGALTYSFDGATDVEPLMAQAIAVTDDGPLWVTGGVPVAIGEAGASTLEVRNRVTLCRCGASSNKPLCDGSHKSSGFTDH